MDFVSASFDETANSPEFPSGRLIFFKNDGTGSFESGTDIGLLDSARSVVAADTDNDGDFDVVASDYLGGRIVWYENDGQGHFSAAIDIALDVGVTRVSQSLNFRSHDGDDGSQLQFLVRQNVRRH